MRALVLGAIVVGSVAAVMAGTHKVETVVVPTEAVQDGAGKVIVSDGEWVRGVQITDTSVEDVEDPDTAYVVDVESYPEHCTGTLDINDFSHPVCDPDEEAEKAKPQDVVTRMFITNGTYHLLKAKVFCMLPSSLEEGQKLIDMGETDMAASSGCYLVEPKVSLQYLRSIGDKWLVLITGPGGEKTRAWTTRYGEFSQVLPWEKG